MKTIMNVILFWIAILLPVLAMGQEDQIDRIIKRLRGSGNFSVVTPDVREEVIRRIRKDNKDSYAKSVGNARSDYFILARLGDVDAASQLLEALRESFATPAHGFPDRIFFESEAPPMIVPLIAGDFFKDDGETISAAGGDDYMYYVYPLSVEMCVLVLQKIRYNETFARETREWAKYNSERVADVPPRLTRELMQRWWRENETPFRAGDYGAVQPGERLPPSTRPPAKTIGVDRYPVPKATPATPIPTLPPAPAVLISTPVDKKVSISAPAVSAVPPERPWRIIVVIGLLAASAAFFWKRRT